MAELKKEEYVIVGNFSFHSPSLKDLTKKEFYAKYLGQVKGFDVDNAWLQHQKKLKELGLIGKSKNAKNNPAE